MCAAFRRIVRMMYASANVRVSADRLLFWFISSALSCFIAVVTLQTSSAMYEIYASDGTISHFRAVSAELCRVFGNMIILHWTCSLTSLQRNATGRCAVIVWVMALFLVCNATDYIRAKEFLFRAVLHELRALTNDYTPFICCAWNRNRTKLLRQTAHSNFKINHTHLPSSPLIIHQFYQIALSNSCTLVSLNVATCLATVW